MSTIIDLMLSIKRWNELIFYHKDTNVYDRYQISEIKFKNIDPNTEIPMKDYNNFRFLTYDEIDHKDIMSFYVRECVEDKVIRKQLFNILRRHDFVDAFLDELRKNNLYDDFDMICGDIYVQKFQEWTRKNELSF